MSSLPSPAELAAKRRWDELGDILCDLDFLEGRAKAGQIEQLLVDLAFAERLPPRHPRRQILRLIREAITLDCNFLRENPGSLFQVLWNRGWWYDCPAAAAQYEPVRGIKPPWSQRGPKLYKLLESWLPKKQRETGFHWLRSLRAPPEHLGGGVRSVFEGLYFTVSPDGRLIAVDASDGPSSSVHRIHIHETNTGRLVRDLPGHATMMHGLTFSPDGRRLASSASEVKVWDVESGALVQTFTGHLPKYWAHVRGAQSSMSVGREFAERLRAGEPSEILRETGYKEWARGKLEVRTEGPWIHHPVFLDGGRRVLSCAYEAKPTYRIWNVESGKQLQIIECADMYGIDFVLVSPDSRRMLTGEYRPGCMVFDLATGAELYREPELPLGHGANGRPVAISPDGNLYAFGKRSNEVRLVDARDFRPVKLLQGPTDKITTLAFSPDGATLAAGSCDTTVCVWNVSNGNLLVRYRGHRPPGHRSPSNMGNVGSLSWSPDGKWLASAADDGMLRIWNARNGRDVHVLPGMYEGVRSAEFLPDGRRLAGCIEHDWVAIWDLQHAAPYRPLISGVPSRDRVGSGMPSPDRNSFCFQLPDHTIRILDAQTGIEKARLEGAECAVWGVRWYPDGSHIAAASKDGTMRVWDARTGAEKFCLRGHKGGVNRVVVPPHGRWLATGGDDGTVRIWSPTTGRQRNCFTGHTADIHFLKVLDNGLLLSFSGCDNTTRLWNVERGKAVGVFQADFEYHDDLKLSPDGRRIVFIQEKSFGTTTDDYRCEYTPASYDTQSGRRIAEFRGHRKNYIEDVAFLPDGEHVATSGGDGAVRVWNLETGRQLHRLAPRRGSVPYGQLCTDRQTGHLICLPSNDGRDAHGRPEAAVWDWRTGKCLNRTTDSDEIRRLRHPNRAWYFSSTRETAQIRDVQTGAVLAVMPLLVSHCQEFDRRRGILQLRRGLETSYNHIMKLEGEASKRDIELATNGQ